MHIFKQERSHHIFTMREIVHMQAGQCGNQIGAKVGFILFDNSLSCTSFYCILIRIATDKALFSS